MTASDHTLYEHIARRVAHGQSYYDATAVELRFHDAGMTPFATFRLPTMAWLQAVVDVETLAIALLALAALAWVGRPAVSAAIVAGAPQALFGLGWIHEVWGRAAACRFCRVLRYKTLVDRAAHSALRQLDA